MHARETRPGRWLARPVYLLILAGACLLLAACSAVSAAGLATASPAPTSTAGPSAFGPTNTAAPAAFEPTATPAVLGPKASVSTVTATGTTESAVSTAAAGNTPGPTATPGAADQNPPDVKLVSPSTGSVLPAEDVARVTVSASDDKGIVQINLYLDNFLYRSWNSPFSTGVTTQTLDFAWVNLDPGRYTLTAGAVDSAGLAATSQSVVVTVATAAAVTGAQTTTTPAPTTPAVAATATAAAQPTPATPAPPPQVQIVQPTGTTVIQAGQQFTIESTATAAAGVARVELWADGQIYASTSSGSASGESPFTVTQEWSSDVIGDHTLFVRAYDTLGQWADSAPVTFGITDTNPPAVTVSVSSTTVNAGDTVTVHTSATDSKGVTDIELWVDGAQVSVMSSTSPVGQYLMQADQTWTASQVGQHTLYTVVHDSVGKSTQSENLVVNVVSRGEPSPTPTATPATPTPAATVAASPTPTATPAPPATVTPTATPQPPGAFNLSGQWNGVGQPSGREWDIQITESGSSLTGTVDVGVSPKGLGGALAGSLSNSGVSGRTVHLEARLTPRGGGAAVTLSFDGTLESDANVLSGAWHDSLGNSGTVTLQRS